MSDIAQEVLKKIFERASQDICHEFDNVSKELEEAINFMKKTHEDVHGAQALEVKSKLLGKNRLGIMVFRPNPIIVYPKDQPRESSFDVFYFSVSVQSKKRFVLFGDITSWIEVSCGPKGGDHRLPKSHITKDNYLDILAKGLRLHVSPVKNVEEALYTYANWLGWDSRKIKAHLEKPTTAAETTGGPVSAAS